MSEPVTDHTDRWYDIGTAPRDGRLIVIYAAVDPAGRKRNHQCVVYWSIKDPWVRGWEVYGSGSFLHFEPTHWRYPSEPPNAG